jgi:hypothetical protein
MEIVDYTGAVSTILRDGGQMGRRRGAQIAAILGIAGTVLLGAELNDKIAPRPNHPAIQYQAGPLRDPVTLLNAKLQAGTVKLKYEGPQGYLRSVLDALHVPVESQIAVFSKTSVQFNRIEPSNPRTIFFNDSVSVAWMYGGFIELTSQDPQRGTVFYTLAQQTAFPPFFESRGNCLSCHLADATLGVAGLMIRSVFTSPDGNPRLIFGSSLVDHRTPVEERWGGYYVTGVTGGVRHMGNAIVTDEENPKSMITSETLRLRSLEGKFDTTHYLTPFSDAGALMVFNHQMHMSNLITRVGWEVRAAEYNRSPDLPGLLQEAAQEFVDYLLFADEAPLPGSLEHGSPPKPDAGFREKFASEGPRDRKGRSLRDLDLERRLLRYPCSYMIYSEAFDALPESAKDAIYQRMWKVLSGPLAGKSAEVKKYSRLTSAGRRAVVEILKDTKKGLPAYFQ